MARARRRFTPEFKAEVVFTLLRGDKTLAQVCREHNLGSDLVSHWRQVVVSRAHELFEARTNQALELSVLKEACRWPRSASASNGR